MDYQMISKIPFEDGIYIMFEKGQKQGELDRIVRVGTHTAEGRLKARLKDHFISQNKDGSIFRKNVGKALLSKNKDSYLDIWTLDMANKRNTTTIDKVKEAEIETAVSNYLHNNISFVCFPINNKEARLRIEEALISLLNRSDDFYPDNNWLGKFSPVDRICRSGLWLTQGLDAEPYAQGVSQLIGNETVITCRVIEVTKDTGCVECIKVELTIKKICPAFV
jgi:hypothetical protein